MNLDDYTTVTQFSPGIVVPNDGREGVWVGRVWVPAKLAANSVAGPRVVVLRDGMVCETVYPTMSALLNDPDHLCKLDQPGVVLASLADIVQASQFNKRSFQLADEDNVVLLAPNDLMATKACGVTFVRSLLERVVEEKAKGDPGIANEIRGLIMDTLGDDLSKVVPGSPQTDALKQKFIAAGVWSQYLEVGIGKDAEVFTKAQPMASVGYGCQIGVLPDSTWNNPEPEVVLAVSRDGVICGATLGNDVNLRDYEGRSALLLGEAKDQNGSCAIGPFIRLFDPTFGLEDITQLEIQLSITGVDGFETTGRNRMSEISRPPADLVAQAIGKHHQYPDGLMLFLGTMFAPTDNREAGGGGFTHHLGDRVEISTEKLGCLVNWVNHTDQIPPWDYGVGSLLEYLCATRA
ncbi:fumarylacetoacetate hydrolase family protein [Neorhodopirellula lusitana]|uniref:fumarylacetoacetate hydrolase family protein n=1 Tax=Neorhodopirellula lusitana TaxID=445327 RepID=UPI003850984F